MMHEQWQKDKKKKTKHGQQQQCQHQKHHSKDIIENKILHSGRRKKIVSMAAI